MDRSGLYLGILSLLIAVLMAGTPVVSGTNSLVVYLICLTGFFVWITVGWLSFRMYLDDRDSHLR